MIDASYLKSPLQFDEFDFENLYNNETIYPAPPWYGNSILSKYFKAKKGPYLLSTLEIEKELIKFPQSEDLLPVDRSQASAHPLPPRPLPPRHLPINPREYAPAKRAPRLQWTHWTDALSCTCE